MCAAERQGLHSGDTQAGGGEHPQEAGPQDAGLPQGRAAAAEAAGPRPAAVPGLPAAATAPPPAAVPAAAAAAVPAVLRLGCGLTHTSSAVAASSSDHHHTTSIGTAAALTSSSDQRRYC